MREGKSYKKLILYTRMLELVKLVYELTKQLPKEEIYGLTSQMRRASVSVISNFVEGYAKSTCKHKLVFFERARTSTHELNAQNDVCFHLEYFSQEEYDLLENKTNEVSYLIYQYSSKLKE